MRRMGKERPAYLSATCRQKDDKGLIDQFKAVCSAQGLSVQKGLLRAVRAYLQANQ